MFERLADLAAEHAQLEKDLADPALHTDQDRARKLSRRYGELTPIVQAYTEWQQTSAWMTPFLAVLRVVNVLPQLQVTVVSTYSG